MQRMPFITLALLLWVSSPSAKAQDAPESEPAEWIVRFGEKAEITPDVAREMVDIMFQSIGQALSKGERVVIAGFGAFSVQQRSARSGRNPSTGGPISIPEAKIPVFKAGKNLKDLLNEEQASTTDD